MLREYHGFPSRGIIPLRMQRTPLPRIQSWWTVPSALCQLGAFVASQLPTHSALQTQVEHDARTVRCQVASGPGNAVDLLGLVPGSSSRQSFPIFFVMLEDVMGSSRSLGGCAFRRKMMRAVAVVQADQPFMSTRRPRQFLPELVSTRPLFERGRFNTCLARSPSSRKSVTSASKQELSIPFACCRL